MIRSRTIRLAGLATLLLASPLAAQVPSPDLGTAQAAISGSDMKRHIQLLSSDEYEGRAPGSRGEDLTVSYIVEQFRANNIKTGNPDGTYVQKVPLVGFKTAAEGKYPRRRQGPSS